MPRITDESWKIVLGEYKRGDTISDIAGRWGLSERGVLYGLRKRGVTSRASATSTATASTALAAVAISDERLAELGVPHAEADLETRRKLALDTAERSAALVQAAAQTALEGLLASAGGMSQSALVRSLDSLSNALSRAAKTRAQALGITDNNRDDGELPELVLRTLTDEEVFEMRRQQEAEASGFLRDDPDLEDEFASIEDNNEDDDKVVYDAAAWGGGNDA